MVISAARRGIFAVAIIAGFTTSTRAERLPLRIYTTTDGLASSVVLDVVPDSRGFLWLATRNGLSRFDGTEFRTYTTDDGLPHPVVNTILETRDGEYWIGTNGGGVCRFHFDRPAAAGPQRLFDCQSVGANFRSSRVNALFEDSQQRLLVGTDDGVFLVHRVGVEWSIETLLSSLPGAPTIAAYAFYEEGNRQLWIGLTQGILQLNNAGDAVLYTVQGRDRHEVTSITSEGDVLLFGSMFGLIAFRPATMGTTPVGHHVLTPGEGCVQQEPRGLLWPVSGKAVCVSGLAQGLPDDYVRALHRSASGRLWIATASGVVYRDGTRLTSLATAEHTENMGFYALAEHGEGSLWLGTTAGALRVTLGGLVSYGSRDGLGHPRIHQLIEDQSGTVFAISGEWFVNRFDGQRFQSMRPRLPTGVMSLYASHHAFLDSTDRWWLMTDKGLHRLAAATTFAAAMQGSIEVVYDQRSGLPSDRVLRLFEDSRGDIWIATRSVSPTADLSRWQRASGELRVVDAALGVDAQLPIAFAEDRNGAVWIGFEGGVLARFRDNQFRAFHAADGVPRDIADLHVDRSGRLWIASGEGLRLVEDAGADTLHVIRFTTSDGLSTNSIRCLTEDRWGRIYLGTPRGIDRLDPATRQVKRLTTAEGLAGDFVTAALRDRSGALWFGTTDGVSRLVPTLDSPSVAPRISIGEVRVGGALHPTAALGEASVGAITLTPERNHLQIGFFGLGLGVHGALKYRYRLEGSEPDWTGPTDRRIVYYTSLAPGRYRFLVEAITSDGVVSAKAASVSFRVLPPIWLRSWFLLSLALVASAFLYLGYRYRLARLLELERVRTRIAADLHDDIGGSLSRIAIHSEVARSEVGTASEMTDRRLRQIAESARDTVDALSDVVWAVDPRQDDLASVERRLKTYAAEILSDRGVRWTFDGVQSDRLSLEPQARRDLYLLLKEAITNVAAHAAARTASLRLQLVGRNIVAELRDDGVGFDDQAAAHGDGRGLANMRERAGRLGGTLAIDSSPGAGTCITISVPLTALTRMTMRLSPRRG